VADQPQPGTDSSSGGPNPSGKNKTPFSVAQARRELREAERILKDYEKRNVSGQMLDDAKQAVKDARKELERLTTGPREERREARSEFMQEYYNELGGPWVAELVKRDPELRKIFEKAIRTDDLDGFMDDLFQSKWWNDPKRSGSWKSAFQLEFAKDKTGWNDALEQARIAIREAADDIYGMEIPDNIIDQIARRYLYQGWDKNQGRGLRTWLASQFKKQSANEESGLAPSGLLVDTERTFRDAARNFGLFRPADWASKTAASILDPESGLTEDDAWNDLIAEAESLYPAFAGKLAKDRSVRDVAAGYIGQLARYLEINDPEMIDLQDPLLQKAFTNLDQNSNPALMPLWQFTQEIKKDGRWQYTTNALDTYSRIGSDLSRMMGFVG
jgi:hypothetical protein